MSEKVFVEVFAIFYERGPGFVRGCTFLNGLFVPYATLFLQCTNMIAAIFVDTTSVARRSICSVQSRFRLAPCALVCFEKIVDPMMTGHGR